MKTKLISLAIVATALQGCVSSDVQKSVRGSVDSADARAKFEMRKATAAFDPEMQRRESEVNAPYLFTKTSALAREVTLPKALQKNVKTELLFTDKETDNWISLNTFGERIRRATGIFVYVAADVYSDAETLPAKQADEKVVGLFVPPITTGMPARQAEETPNEQRIGRGVAGRQETPNSFYFPRTGGQLVGILDTVSNKLHIHWRYDEATNTIHFYRFVTKYWQTKFTSTSYSFNNGQQGQTVQSTDSKSLTGGNQTKGEIETALKDNVELASMKNAIEATILTKQGKIFANPSTGTISMTDTEEAVNAADVLINHEMRNLYRSVMLRVRTIQVTRSDNDSAGIDIQAIINKALSNTPNLSFTANAPGSLTPQNAGSVGVGIFSGAGNGSQAMLTALKELGDVYVSGEYPVIASNRKGTSVDLRDITTYVPNTTAAAATTGGTGGTPGLNTAQIRTGLKLVMLPTLGSDDSATISLKMEESSTPTLEKFTTGQGATLQAVEKPKYQERLNTMDIPMKSGQTMFLVGLERVSEEFGKRTLGQDVPVIAGGSVKVNKSRTLTIIQLSMQIMDAN